MFNLMQKCPNCNSTTLLETLEPEGSVHYARMSCGECNRFIKWLPKPRIPEVCITRLLQNPTLQAWERQFLKTLIYRNPTEAEKIAIRAIEERVKTLHTHQT